MPKPASKAPAFGGPVKGLWIQYGATAMRLAAEALFVASIAGATITNQKKLVADLAKLSSEKLRDAEKSKQDEVQKLQDAEKSKLYEVQQLQYAEKLQALQKKLDALQTRQQAPDVDSQTKSRDELNEAKQVNETQEEAMQSLKVAIQEKDAELQRLKQVESEYRRNKESQDTAYESTIQQLRTQLTNIETQKNTSDVSNKQLRSSNWTLEQTVKEMQEAQTTIESTLVAEQKKVQDLEMALENKAQEMEVMRESLQKEKKEAVIEMRSASQKLIKEAAKFAAAIQKEREERAKVKAALDKELKDQAQMMKEWQEEVARLEKVNAENNSKYREQLYWATLNAQGHLAGAYERLEEELNAVYARESGRALMYADIQKEHDNMEAKLAEAQKELREKSAKYDAENRRFQRGNAAATQHVDEVTRVCEERIAKRNLETSQTFKRNEELEAQMERQKEYITTNVSLHRSEVQRLQDEIRNQATSIESLECANINQKREHDKAMQELREQNAQEFGRDMEQYRLQVEQKKQQEMDDYRTEANAYYVDQAKQQISIIQASLQQEIYQRDQNISSLQANERELQMNEITLNKTILDLQGKVSTLEKSVSGTEDMDVN